MGQNHGWKIDQNMPKNSTKRGDFSWVLEDRQNTTRWSIIRTSRRDFQILRSQYCDGILIRQFPTASSYGRVMERSSSTVTFSKKYGWPKERGSDSVRLLLYGCYCEAEIFSFAVLIQQTSWWNERWWEWWQVWEEQLPGRSSVILILGVTVSSSMVRTVSREDIVRRRHVKTRRSSPSDCWW